MRKSSRIIQDIVLKTGIPLRQQLHDCRFSVMKIWRSEWPKDHCPFCGEDLPLVSKRHERIER